MGHFIKPIGFAFFPKIEDYVWETFCFQNLIKGVDTNKDVFWCYLKRLAYIQRKNIQSKMGHFIKPIGLAFFPKIDDYVWETFCIQNLIKGVRQK